MSLYLCVKFVFTSAHLLHSGIKSQLHDKFFAVSPLCWVIQDPELMRAETKQNIKLQFYVPFFCDNLNGFPSKICAVLYEYLKVTGVEVEAP